MDWWIIVLIVLALMCLACITYFACIIVVYVLIVCINMAKRKKLNKQFEELNDDVLQEEQI